MTDLILVGFFFIIVFLCTYYKNDGAISDTNFLTKDQTDWMKGIGALMIFLHHLSSRVEGEVFLDMGYLGVGLFLFVSGYGLYYSYRKNGKGYVKKLFLKKIPEIIAICLVSCILNYAFYYFFDVPVTIDEIRWVIFGSRLQNWYFPNAIMLYILFGLAILTGHKHNHVFLISMCFGIEFILIKFYFRHDIGIHLYISDIAFLFGIVVSRFRQEIVKLLRKIHPEAVLLSAFLLFALLYVIIFNIHLLPVERLFKIIMEVILISFIIFLSLFAINKKSKSLLRFMAVHSAEMILVQRISLPFSDAD